jgi:hypothetical protein
MDASIKKCEYCQEELKNKDDKRKLRRDKKFCSQKCHDKSKYSKSSESKQKFKDEYGLNKYTLKGITKKLELIELFGGKCEKCGYDKNISAFDFHHRDPDEKKFEIKIQYLNYKDDTKILEEALKCMLLCANCHREVHYPHMDKVHVQRVVKLNNNISNNPS